MNRQLILSIAAVSMFYMPGAAFARHKEPVVPPPHNTPPHGTLPGATAPPTFQPTICNCSGNYPADGASAAFVQLPGSGVGVSVRRADVADGVGLGMQINCDGMPVDSFQIFVSGPQVGGPFMTATVRSPGQTTGQLNNIPFSPISQNSSGTTFAMQQGVFPKGTLFGKIYILDDEGPVNRTFSNAILDGVKVMPSSHRTTLMNCDGWLFPPQPLPEGAACSVQ